MAASIPSSACSSSARRSVLRNRPKLPSLSAAANLSYRLTGLRWLSKTCCLPAARAGMPEICISQVQGSLSVLSYPLRLRSHGTQHARTLKEMSMKEGRTDCLQGSGVLGRLKDESC
jgi:hypothetical protein